MQRVLLLFFFSLFLTSELYSQTFRMTRPADDSKQTNGSYLYGEPALRGFPHAHLGIDISMNRDTVYAAHDGVVGFLGDQSGGCGIYIMIDDYWDGKKMHTLYCHLHEVLVTLNQEVEAGEPVAISGATGNVTGPHLHFEVRVGNHSNESNPQRNRRNAELWVAMEGMGAIYGNISGAADGTRVDINPDPKPRPPYTTYGWTLTYRFADTGIGRDDIYKENYAIGDVVPGTYTITALNGSYTRFVTVGAGQVVNADSPPTSIEREELAGGILLHQNYPNPFNPSTTIRFELPEADMVNLRVYSLHGQEVATLASGIHSAGRHEVNFDASSLSSGLYIYELISGNTRLTRKMTLVK